MSQTGLWPRSFGVALWIYAIVREAWRHGYTCVMRSAVVGWWSSLGLIVVSALAESKPRRYLILGSAGLLYFFGVSIGEVTI
jgi:hypothetical protein